MIPDGTSIGVYSISRWFNHFNGKGDSLHIDPYLTGTVTTFSSNAPIGDSAPTGSTYATGVLSQSGNVAMHPEKNPNDLFEVDSIRQLQPATTILEASKILLGKSVGIVATCEFPHATPADFSAHHYNRSNYGALASQMAYQNLNVLFAGGNSLVTDDIKKHLSNRGTTLIQDDRQALLNYNGSPNVWALYGKKALPYDIDRNPEEIPSIAEMTRKALEVLSKDENGFFLMVEGSQVDWAAHANDVAAIIHEFLAFDEAVGAVMDFAEKDGNTAVVIMSDHGNSGITLGSKRCPGYDKLPIENLFEAVSKYQLSANGLEAILVNTKPEEMRATFAKYTGIELTDEELKLLLSSKNYKESNYMEIANSPNMIHTIGEILTSRTCFGFTTGGHTGEETLLASYHPAGDELRGHVKNTQVNRYLQSVSGLDMNLTQLSDKLFAKHTDVLDGFKYDVDMKDPKFPVLTVKKGRKKMAIKAFTSVITVNGKPVDLGSVVVYIDKNNTFYLPADIAKYLD